MSINSISGDVAAFKLQSSNTAASLDKLAKGTPASDSLASNQTVQPDVVDTIANKKVSLANKTKAIEESGGHQKPARAMSHVVETYNLHGQVRIKFMDNHNNVVYQIPSEMVAKVEDQMMKPETSTNIKG